MRRGRLDAQLRYWVLLQKSASGNQYRRARRPVGVPLTRSSGREFGVPHRLNLLSRARVAGFDRSPGPDQGGGVTARFKSTKCTGASLLKQLQSCELQRAAPRVHVFFYPASYNCIAKDLMCKISCGTRASVAAVLLAVGVGYLIEALIGTSPRIWRWAITVRRTRQSPRAERGWA